MENNTIIDIKTKYFNNKAKAVDEAQEVK